MNRIERLAAILLLLQERPHTSDEIARRFEISRRTVLRDVEALSEMGVPVIAREGPGGGYSLPGEYRTTPLPLTGSEAFLLLLALNALERLSDLPFRQERASLLTKLRALLPGSQLSGTERLLAAVGLDIPEREQRAPFLDGLVEAVRTERWVRATYQSSQRISTQHLLPRQVYAQDGYWYCRAYADERQEERTYRVDRIQALEPPEAGFAPGPILNGLPYQHESHPEIAVQLTARGAALLETDRHLGHQLRRGADGSGTPQGGGTPQDGAYLIFHCPPGELDYYARLFTSLGQEVEVLAPEELRQRMRALGEYLLQQYSKR